MKSLVTKSFVTTALLLVMFSVVAAPVQAQSAGTGVSICSFIAPICNAIGISDEKGNIYNPNDSTNAAQRFVRDRAQLILSLVFIGIILLSVVIIIQAGIKYIQSQGNEGQIKEAQKAIKSVFIGIGVLFVGIVGIVLVLLFFNAQGFLNPAGDNPNEGCFFDEDGFLVCPDGNGNRTPGSNQGPSGS